MNKYEQMLFTMKSFEKSGQEKSAKKAEDKLVNALKIGFEKGEAEALEFCQKYNIDPFQDDVVEGEFVEVAEVKKPKEESKFFKWLKPYINTIEEIYMVIMSSLFLLMIIYVFLLWG